MASSKQNARKFNCIMPKFAGILIFGIACLLLSCGVTHKVAVSVWEPAPVDLANGIKRIGIINQSQETKVSEQLSGVEAWVAHSDEELSATAKHAAIDALYKELSSDERFDTILILPQNSNYVAFSFADQEVIPWDEMANLCHQYSVDALFALAFHETDTEISIKKAKIRQRDLLRDNYTIKGHELKLETLIENGWRIYDPFNKLILDEISINNQIVSKGAGEDPYLAFEAIEDRRDSVMLAGKKSGIKFGSRINPYSQTISRPYYAKGSVNLIKADSLARVSEWKNATKLWEKDLSHPSAKVRSRAYFNMAVVNELHGDLATAMDWASKSIDIYDSRFTQRYLDDLYHRMSRQTLIEEQAMN